jgi:hypothetical protein
MFLLTEHIIKFKVPNVKPVKKGMRTHSPSCYTSILDLLHKDPKLSLFLTPQADYTETEAAPFWLEQLKCDNRTHTPQNSILSILWKSRHPSFVGMQMDTVLYFTETWKALMLPFVDLNAKIN